MWKPTVALLLFAVGASSAQEREANPPQLVIRIETRIACPMPVHWPARVPYMPIFVPPPSDDPMPVVRDMCFNPLFQDPGTSEFEERSPDRRKVEAFAIGSEYVLIVWTDEAGRRHVKLFRIA